MSNVRNIKPLLDFINAVFSMLTTSTGLVIGCIVGLFVSYTVYVLLSGHEFQVILSALAYIASVFLGLVVETSWEKHK
jgi:multisubunit Na+/H+ antiporter MnhE subunit